MAEGASAFFLNGCSWDFDGKPIWVLVHLLEGDEEVRLFVALDQLLVFMV